TKSAFMISFSPLVFSPDLIYNPRTQVHEILGYPDLIDMRVLKAFMLIRQLPHPCTDMLRYFSWFFLVHDYSAFVHYLPEESLLFVLTYRAVYTRIVRMINGLYIAFAGKRDTIR